jgi:uncharacterized protein YjbJ (UPF0337 family)
LVVHSTFLSEIESLSLFALQLRLPSEVGRRAVLCRQPQFLAPATSNGRPLKGPDVDKKRTEDTAKQVRGSVLEAIGKLTGDAEVEARGAAEKSAGEAKKPGDVAPGKTAKPK